jgi:hypothetical protein
VGGQPGVSVHVAGGVRGLTGGGIGRSEQVWPRGTYELAISEKPPPLLRHGGGVAIPSSLHGRESYRLINGRTRLSFCFPLQPALWLGDSDLRQ